MTNFILKKHKYVTISVKMKQINAYYLQGAYLIEKKEDLHKLFINFVEVSAIFYFLQQLLYLMK